MSTISEWESKRFSNEKFKSTYTSNKIISPKLAWMNNTRLALEFKGSCLTEEDANPYKYSYSEYRIGIDSCSLFSIPNFDWGKNSIICGVDMRSSLHADNTKTYLKSW